MVIGRTWRAGPDECVGILADLRPNYDKLVPCAAEGSVRLALEPLNRCETTLFNTTSQLLEFIADFDPTVLGLNLDTYHMNVEGRSFRGPLALSQDELAVSALAFLSDMRNSDEPKVTSRAL
jgi:D-psicose/D-tagatose/L-ribulose 3-epimerase